MAVSSEPAVNGIEPRNICILLDCADAVHYVAGNTGQRATGERCLGTRGRRPGRASQHVTMATREIPVALVRVDEYARQAEEAREANGDGEVGRLHSTYEAG